MQQRSTILLASLPSKGRARRRIFTLGATQAGGWVRRVGGYIELRGYVEQQVADLSALLTLWPRSGLEQLQPAATARVPAASSVRRQTTQYACLYYYYDTRYHYLQIAFCVSVARPLMPPSDAFKKSFSDVFLVETCFGNY